MFAYHTWHRKHLFNSAAISSTDGSSIRVSVNSREGCVTKSGAKFLSSSGRLPSGQEAQPNLRSRLSIHISLQQDVSYPKKITVFHRDHNYPLLLRVLHSFPAVVVAPPFSDIVVSCFIVVVVVASILFIVLVAIVAMEPCISVFPCCITDAIATKRSASWVEQSYTDTFWPSALFQHH